MKTLNLGFDRGNQRTNVAVLTETNKLLEFDASSLVAEANLKKYQGLKSGSASSDSIGLQELMVEYEGSMYFLSDFARQGQNPTADFGDKHRYYNKHTKVSLMCFAAIAAAQIWPGSLGQELAINLVMGVPLRAYQEQAEKIVEELTGTYRYQFMNGRDMTITIETVKVFMEGAGAIVYHGFDKEASTGIIDSGSLTTGLLRFDGHKAHTEQSDSFEIGVNTALDRLNAKFEARYGRELDDDELQDVLRASIGQRAFPSLYANSVQVSGADVHQWIKAAIAETGDERNAKIASLWSNQSGKVASRFKQVLHCGGGAYYFHPSLQKIIKGAVQMEEPEKANARGYAVLADQIGQRRLLRRA